MKVEWSERENTSQHQQQQFRKTRVMCGTTPETMQLDGYTTCKHRKGVIHTNNDDDHLGTMAHSEDKGMSSSAPNEDTKTSHFPFVLLHHENSLCVETRSSREYNNNKLGFAAQVTPEDLDNEGDYLNSATTATSPNPYLLEKSYRAAGPTAGRFSRRKLNIFQMYPLLLLLVSMSLAGVTGVRINSLTVPQIIRNGTEDSVILDCDYTVDEAEKKGLVVKWFHERKQSPVYQWIPKKEPIVLGILKGKLNLDFKADSDEFKLHRALQIVRPTIELSGDWICEVSTFEGEAYKADRMIIYAPEKDMGIHVSENRRDGRVNVSCWATNVFPEPRLILFREDQMVDDLVVTTKLIRGAYDVSAYKIIEDANLSSLASTYECELTIPNTNYMRRQTKLYEPGSLELRDEMAMGSAGPSPLEFFNMSTFYFWIPLALSLTFSMTSAAVLLQEVAPLASSSLLLFCL